MGAAPLNGTYGSALCDDCAPSPDVGTSSPVRFAPLGPIGRLWSVNAHVDELQMQSPLSGSQNGVEQFAGRRNRAWCPLSVDCGGLGLEGVGGSSGQPYCNARASQVSGWDVR